jgi:hypothetical protein
MTLALEVVFRSLQRDEMKVARVGWVCDGCMSPQDYDNTSWVTMSEDDYARLLDRLRTCRYCRAALDTSRSRRALAAVCKHP